MELLRRFAFHGIRMTSSISDAAYNGTTYPKGTWVIPMDQEYASLVQEVFEVQHYPDMGDDTPYDAAGWTLPFQMGVNVVEATTPLSAEFRAALKPVTPGKAVDWHTAPDAPFTMNATAAGIVPRAGRLHGHRRSSCARSGAEQFVQAHRARAGRRRQGRVPGRRRRASRYVVSGVAPAKMDAWASELWVTGERTSGRAGTSRLGLAAAHRAA